MSRCGKSMSTPEILFCPATQQWLQLWCSSIIVDLLNTEWLKLNFFNLCSDVNVITEHSRLWQITLLHLLIITWKSRHPQDGRYKRSSPGAWALPLATTFKCDFFAQTKLLLSSEPLAVSAANGSAAADEAEEAAFGELGSCRHNNKLVCSWPSVSCCCNECAAFTFKCARRRPGRTGSVNAGQQGAGGPAGQRLQEQTWSSGTSYHDVLRPGKLLGIYIHAKSYEFIGFNACIHSIGRAHGHIEACK